MLSNLIGGIGFFHGDDVVDRSAAPEYDEENEGFWEETAEARARAQPVLEGPKDLFTCVPSRPFFPRGFLWDEGFHLIPVIDWDTDLAYVPRFTWPMFLGLPGLFPIPQYPFDDGPLTQRKARNCEELAESDG
jgi:hypothetical protein